MVTTGRHSAHRFLTCPRTDQLFGGDHVETPDKLIRWCDDGTGPKTVHIETDGATCQLTVGHRDNNGRPVEVLAVAVRDDLCGGDGKGGVWYRVPDTAATHAIVRQAANGTPPRGPDESEARWSLHRRR